MIYPGKWKLKALLGLFRQQARQAGVSVTEVKRSVSANPLWRHRENLPKDCGTIFCQGGGRRRTREFNRLPDARWRRLAK